MLVLRTQRPFWKSKPGTGLWLSSLILEFIVISLPYLWIGPKLAIDGVPGNLLLTFAVLILVYAAVNEYIKRKLLASHKLK
jgi:Mg2+-importing ATPase